MLHDLLVATLNLIKEDSSDQVSMNNSSSGIGLCDWQVIGEIALKTSESILKPLLVQQRNSLGHVESDLCEKYLQISTVGMKSFNKCTQGSSENGEQIGSGAKQACLLQQRVWEVIEGLDLLKISQQKCKRAVPEDLFTFVSCSLKTFMM